MKRANEIDYYLDYGIACARKADADYQMDRTSSEACREFAEVWRHLTATQRANLIDALPHLDARLVELS